MTTTDAPNPSEVAGPPRPASRRISTGTVVAAVAVTALAAVAVAWLAVRAFTPHLYAGTVLQGDDPAPSMEGLSFVDGSPADPAHHPGSVILVFFGYTNCPDVCPTTMARAARALSSLNAEDRQRVEVWMVTVDPDRDDPQSLETYVDFFAPDDTTGFRGVSGPVDAVDAVVSRYGVFYQLGQPSAGDAEDYTVDHTAQLFGIGPDGSLRVLWSPTVTDDQLAADVAELLP